MKEGRSIHALLFLAKQQWHTHLHPLSPSWERGWVRGRYNQQMDVRAVLIEMREGREITPPARMLNRIKPVDAARKLPDHPYSLITNLAHMVLWQDYWLARITGTKQPDITKDWRVPEPNELEDLTERFLNGLDDAIALAEFPDHDQIASESLAKIAVHNSYHLGQINLSKRSLRLERLRLKDQSTS